MKQLNSEFQVRLESLMKKFDIEKWFRDSFEETLSEIETHLLELAENKKEICDCFDASVSRVKAISLEWEGEKKEAAEKFIRLLTIEKEDKLVLLQHLEEWLRARKASSPFLEECIAQIFCGLPG